MRKASFIGMVATAAAALLVTGVGSAAGKGPHKRSFTAVAVGAQDRMPHMGHSKGREAPPAPVRITMDELHAQGGIQRRQRPVEACTCGQLVAVVIDDLRR